MTQFGAGQMGNSKVYLTVEEANDRLPLVRSIVRDLVELYHDVQLRRERLLVLMEGRDAANRQPHLQASNIDYEDEVAQMEAELDKDEDRIVGFVEELNEIGAVLKDPHLGLVDFLSRRDDTDIWLCWKPGEPELAYWHAINEGFSGRQPLMEAVGPGSDSDLGIDDFA